MRRARRLIKGAWRLRFGFCPECNSSPPRPECTVCEGWPGYGTSLDPKIEALWWERYKKLTRAEAA